MRINVKEKLAELFFDFPTRRFHIREISRILKISATAVSKAVRTLETDNFIVFKRGFMAEIYANLNQRFKNTKRIYNLKRIYDSGLFDYLIENFPFSTIVLFGSYSRGEDSEKSDIDVAIFNEEKKLKIENFEKKLKRRINIEFINFKKAKIELKESLINGIILTGDITLR